MFARLPLLALAVTAITSVVSGKPTFSINDLPDKWEEGQIGTNRCQKWGDSSQDSMCQNVFINSAVDFCLWAPPHGTNSVGDMEEKMVSYCTKSGYGTRLIPDGTIKSAYFIKTNSFLEVRGEANFNNMHIDPSDEGGELDPHGANGSGNPIGGLVFTRNKKGSEGKWVQLKEWNNFMSHNEYSFRACWGGWAAHWCPHIYDEMGSRWNSPGPYKAGKFENCEAEEGEWPGVYNGSTFYQGQGHTPKAQKPGKSSNCRNFNTVKNGEAKQKPYRRALRFERN